MTKKAYTEWEKLKITEQRAYKAIPGLEKEIGYLSTTSYEDALEQFTEALEETLSHLSPKQIKRMRKGLSSGTRTALQEMVSEVNKGLFSWAGPELPAEFATPLFCSVVSRREASRLIPLEHPKIIKAGNTIIELRLVLLTIQDLLLVIALIMLWKEKKCEIEGLDIHLESRYVEIGRMLGIKRPSDKSAKLGIRHRLLRLLGCLLTIKNKEKGFLYDGHILNHTLMLDPKLEEDSAGILHIYMNRAIFTAMERGTTRLDRNVLFPQSGPKLSDGAIAVYIYTHRHDNFQKTGSLGPIRLDTFYLYCQLGGQFPEKKTRGEKYREVDKILDELALRSLIGTYDKALLKQNDKVKISGFRAKKALPEPSDDNKGAKKALPVSRNQCPFGLKFGVGADDAKSCCDVCKVWAECSDEKDRREEKEQRRENDEKP